MKTKKVVKTTVEGRRDYDEIASLKRNPLWRLLQDRGMLIASIDTKTNDIAKLESYKKLSTLDAVIIEKLWREGGKRA